MTTLHSVLAPAVCDPVTCIYYIIKPRAATLKTTQREALKTAINKSKWNSKNVQETHRKARKEKHEKGNLRIPKKIVNK